MELRHSQEDPGAGEGGLGVADDARAVIRKEVMNDLAQGEDRGCDKSREGHC